MLPAGPLLSLWARRGYFFMTLFFMLLVMWLILCSRFTLEVLLIGAAL